MRKKYVLIFVCSLIFYCSFAQVVFEKTKEQKLREHPLTVSFQVMAGPTAPRDVNQYIQDYIDDRMGGNPYFTINGPSEIKWQGSLNFSLVAPVNDRFKLRFPLEYGGGTTTVTMNDNRKSFNLSRFSVGGVANYYFPINNAGSVFLGAGALYHLMYFERYKAKKFGPRLEFGYRIYDWLAGLDMFASIDIADGTVNERNAEVRKLQFTGIYFGFRAEL